MTKRCFLLSEKSILLSFFFSQCFIVFCLFFWCCWGFKSTGEDISTLLSLSLSLDPYLWFPRRYLLLPQPLPQHLRTTLSLFLLIYFSSFSFVSSKCLSLSSFTIFFLLIILSHRSDQDGKKVTLICPTKNIN